MALLVVMNTGTTPKIVTTRLSATVSPTLVFNKLNLLIPNLSSIANPVQQIVAPVSPVPGVFVIVDFDIILTPGGDNITKFSLSSVIWRSIVLAEPPFLATNFPNFLLNTICGRTLFLPLLGRPERGVRLEPPPLIRPGVYILQEYCCKLLKTNHENLIITYFDEIMSIFLSIQDIVGDKTYFWPTTIISTDV